MLNFVAGHIALRMVGASSCDSYSRGAFKRHLLLDTGRKRFIASTAVNVRQHRTWRRAVIRAIQQQAATLSYANPFMATEVRARLSVNSQS